MRNFSAISWREQVTFNVMMMMSALYTINMLNWIFILLAHWINNPLVGHVAPFWHNILILSQPVFALAPESSVLSREANNINVIVFRLTRPGL